MDTPVVLIVGLHRAGKTTLVRKIGEAGRTYVTLDDQTVLDAAESDPTGFIRGLDKAVIDQIQRARPAAGDQEDGRRGLFPGPVSPHRLGQCADIATGRGQPGWPDGNSPDAAAGQAEIEGRSPSFLERLIAGKLKSQPKAIVGDDLVHLVLRGGFPEAIARESERRQRDWARSYLTSILTRDLRHIADVEKLTELSKFVRLLAAAPLSALWS